MKIESLVSTLGGHVETLKSIQRFVAAHSEAFELLQWCDVHFVSGEWTLICQPPAGTAEQFARLLGCLEWKRMEPSLGWVDWRTKFDQCPCAIRIVQAEQALTQGKEVRL